MTQEEVKSLGYSNHILHDPYKWVHNGFGPSLYETNKDSGKWYFYFEGREIYVDKTELTQLIQIFENK